MPGGIPKSDIERLKQHFGLDWRKHDISELPPRGTGLQRHRNTPSWQEQLKIRNRDIKNIKAISTPKRRESIPANYFLLPKERKFPFKNPDGSLNCNLVKAAITRAGQWGYPEVEKKARIIYQKYCKKQ